MKYTTDAKEYWFNVYDKPIYTSKKNNSQGSPCETKEGAEWVTVFLRNLDNKTLYRIHVRLK